MNALKPRAPFQVLVMSEESRLGREQIETAYALKQLVHGGRARVLLPRGPRAHARLADRQVHASRGRVRRRARARAGAAADLRRDASARRSAGHVTGGRVFGYDNVEVRDGHGRRLHVERRINEDAGRRRAPHLRALRRGPGFTRIAKALNEDARRAAAARRPAGRRRPSGRSSPAALSRRGRLEPPAEARPVGREALPGPARGANGCAGRRPSCDRARRISGGPRTGAWTAPARSTPAPVAARPLTATRVRPLEAGDRSAPSICSAGSRSAPSAAARSSRSPGT